MKKVYVILAFFPLSMGYAGAQRSLPLEWVDSLTGHRGV
jgi:hypothetical protein